MTAQTLDVIDVNHHLLEFDHHTATGPSLVSPASLSDRDLEADAAAHLAILDAQGTRGAVILASSTYVRPRGLVDTRAVNDSVARYRDRVPDRFVAAIGHVDHLYGQAGQDEVTRCHEKLGLVGIGFSGMNFMMRPLVYRMAVLGLIPFIGVGYPNETLWQVDTLAREFPELPMVVLNVFHDVGQVGSLVEVAERRPNLYFDLSGSINFETLGLPQLRPIGARRFLYGTSTHSYPRNTRPFGELLPTSSRRISRRMRRPPFSGVTPNGFSGCVEVPIPSGPRNRRMKNSDGADPAHIITAVNAELGTGWRVVRPLGGSNEGAFLVRRPDDSRAVLEWHSAGSEDLRATADIIKDARRRGWPTPEWYAVGRAPTGQVWLLQEFVSGARPALLDDTVAERMLRILDRQVGMLANGTGTWADWVTAVVAGDEEQLRRRVLPLEGGRRLVDQVDLIAGVCAGTRVGRTDLVHGDFSMMNILVTGQDMYAIDVADLGSGPVAYDLAKTLVVAAILDHATQAGLARLWAHARGLDPHEFSLCAAASALKTAEAVIRHRIHDRAAIHLGRISVVLDHVQRLLGA